MKDFGKFSLPLIRQAYPQLIAADLVAVQPMTGLSVPFITAVQGERGPDAFERRVTMKIYLALTRSTDRRQYTFRIFENADIIRKSIKRYIWYGEKPNILGIDDQLSEKIFRKALEEAVAEDAT